MVWITKQVDVRSQGCISISKVSSQWTSEEMSCSTCFFCALISHKPSLMSSIQGNGSLKCDATFPALIANWLAETWEIKRGRKEKKTNHGKGSGAWDDFVKDRAKWQHFYLLTAGCHFFIWFSFLFCIYFLWAPWVLTETLALIGGSVHEDFGRDDVAKGQKHLHELGIPKLLRQVVDKQVTAFGSCKNRRAKRRTKTDLIHD